MAISQRITLEGGDEVRRAFEQLAAAINRLSPQFKKLTTDTEAFGSAGVRASQQLTTGLNQTSAAAEKTGSSLAAAAVKFTIAAAGIAVAVSALVRSLTTGTGETARNIADTADKLALTKDQWIGLRRQVDAAGGSIEEFTASIAPLLRNLNQLDVEFSGRSIQTFANGAQVTIQSVGKLSQQSQQLLSILEKFGVRRDIIDKGSVAIMAELARIIDGMPEGTAKATAGLQFFGAKWRDAISALVIGYKSVGDAEAEMDNKRRASRQLTEEQVKSAKAAADQWEDLGKAIRATKDLIGSVFSGGSFARAKWLTDMVDDARELLKTWMKLDEAGRAGFLANVGDSEAATVFKILVALGQQLAGVWRVLATAGEKLFSVLDGIAGLFEGITGSQVAAFFITAAIAAAGLAIALKGLALLLTPLTLLMGLFSPFGAVLLAAGAAAFLFWDSIKKGAAQVAALIPGALASMMASFEKLLAGDFVGFWAQFSAAAVEAFNTIAAAAQQTPWVQSLVAGVKQIAAELPGAILLVANAFLSLGAVAQGVADGINRIFGTKLTATDVALIGIVLQLTGGLAALVSIIAAVGLGLGALVSAVSLLGSGWALFSAAITAAASGLTAMMGVLGGPLTLAIVAVGAALTALVLNWDAVKSAAAASIGWITGALDGLINKLREAAKWVGGLFTGSGASAGTGSTMQGFAGGGRVGGRGTGTSDSNLAWVSRGEHIMPARAVRQPGMLAFLEALRRSGGNLSRVIDRMGHFAAGGLVGMPAFAAGGSVGSMSHVTIQFPGMPEIGGLRAPSNVVEQLHKAAAMAQVRSGGRKPSRYR